MKQRVIRLGLLTQAQICVDDFRSASSAHGWSLVSADPNLHPLTWLHKQRVDLAILDLDMPDALDLLREAMRVLPHLPILVAVSQERLRDLQQALTLGAQGFIALPISDSGQFVNTINTLLARHQIGDNVPHRGLCVVVASLKGGVGKSTIAANLAVALSTSLREAKGRRSDAGIILAEMHHGLSDLSLMLNLYPAHTLSTLADEPTVDGELVQGILQEHSSGIRLLPAPVSVTDMVELPAETWRSLLMLLTEQAAVVVVDTAAIVDVALTEALNIADLALVVATPDMPSLKYAVELVDAIRQDESTLAEPFLILNRVGRPGSVSERGIKERLGEKVSYTLPYDPALASYALNRGVPFVLSHPRSRLTRDLNGLTDFVKSRMPTSHLAEPKAGALRGFNIARLKPSRIS